MTLARALPAVIVALLLAPGARAEAQTLATVSRTGDALAFVDLGTGASLGEVAVGAFPHEMAVGPARDRAYVASYGGNTIDIVDLRTRRRIAQYALPGYEALHGIDVSADGDRLWVTAEEQREIVEIDAANGRVLDRWPTGGYRSHMVVAAPDDSRLYVANMDDGTVSVIDRSTREVTIVRSGEGTEGIDVTPDGTEVWASNRGENTISIIDARADEVVARISSGGDFPVKLRIAPDGSCVWVANNRSGSVAVFDRRTRELLASVVVGARPLGLGFSSDGRHAYVSRPSAGEVVEIDTRTFEITRRIPVAPGPDGVAWLAPE